MTEMTPEEAKQVGGSPMFAAMRELSDGGTYKRLDAYFMAAHWWEIWDALSVCLARIEALERAEDEWKQATEYLLEHYPEDVFPAGSNTPDAKAGTFARRLLTWLLDPVERARLAAEENT